MQHIQYAKTKSYATLRKEDPEFLPPNPVAPRLKQTPSALINGAEKRSRDDDGGAEARSSKRERTGADDDGEEMEMDDEDDSARRGVYLFALGRFGAYSTLFTKGAQQVQEQRSARLLCTNLPQEVTDEVLSVLFQQ